MYIAETLINPLFTDVAVHRDSDGTDRVTMNLGRGGGSCPPVTSSICVSAFKGSVFEECGNLLNKEHLLCLCQGKKEFY